MVEVDREEARVLGKLGINIYHRSDKWPEKVYENVIIQPNGAMLSCRSVNLPDFNVIDTKFYIESTENAC